MSEKMREHRRQNLVDQFLLQDSDKSSSDD